MNKFKFYFFLFTIAFFAYSCSKDDTSATIEPPRDFATQYAQDNTDILEYLNTYYITVTNKPGEPEDQDVVMTKIPVGGTQASIMSYLDAPAYPKLLIRKVNLHNIVYDLYYLVIRPGVGESPCNVDGVLTSYRGDYLYRSVPIGETEKKLTVTKFEEVKFPQTTLSLYNVITGWSETFPQFKAGTNIINNDGTVAHYDFGAGVMFLPSGLGYYNTGSGAIPAYSPLIFSFKLYNIERLDQDNDGVYSYQEDINGDGYIYNYSNLFSYPTTPKDEIRYEDDTDKDGIPDILDVDDDGDNYTTRLEITKPGGSNLLLDGPSLYYPYDPIISNPVKLTHEKRGIPSFSATGNPDYTSPGRLRIHVDKDHHTAQ